MQLILVRHTTPDVAKGTCYGWTDLNVADTFDEEAAAVKSNLEGVVVDRIYCSPLTRCRLLAEYCRPNFEIILEPDIREMNFGQWEMTRYDNVVDSRMKDFYDDYLHYRCPDGESFSDLGRRVDRFIESLSGLDKVMLFTHGGVIAHLLVRAGRVPGDNPFAYAPGYGSITEISL